MTSIILSLFLYIFYAFGNDIGYYMQFLLQKYTYNISYLYIYQVSRRFNRGFFHTKVWNFCSWNLRLKYLLINLEIEEAIICDMFFFIVLWCFSLEKIMSLNKRQYSRKRDYLIASYVTRNDEVSFVNRLPWLSANIECLRG